jgi:hypothetical protein
VSPSSNFTCSSLNPRYSAAIMVITVYVPGPMSLVALAPCAVLSARNVILAVAGLWKAPQMPVAVPQPTNRRPSRIERGSNLRSFQPNFSAPSR